MQVKYNGKINEPQHDGDAGYDIRAVDGATLKPHSYAVINTGLRMAIPKGFHAEVRPRSGLMMKGIQAGLGTVDSGYRGEVRVVLFNHSAEYFEVLPDMRIAQIVFIKHDLPDLKEVKEMPGSDRGDGGFGSTGLK